MTDENLAFTATKWTAAIIVAQWSSIPLAVHLLLAFMALDVFSGLVAAVIQKRVSSTASIIGISKKVLVLVVIMMTHLMERAFGVELGLEKAVALAYTLNEAISITENCAKSGVWVPQQVLDVLAKLRASTDPTQHPQQEASKAD